jgi:hypothetical protein
MKVREVISLEYWNKWNGFLGKDTYAEDIYEIRSESELPKTADAYSWDWYETEDWYEMPYDGGNYIKIIVEFYPENAEPGYDEPIVTITKLESDIWKERNA